MITFRCTLFVLPPNWHKRYFYFYLKLIKQPAFAPHSQLKSISNLFSILTILSVPKTLLRIMKLNLIFQYLMDWEDCVYSYQLPVRWECFLTHQFNAFAFSSPGTLLNVLHPLQFCPNHLPGSNVSIKLLDMTHVYLNPS